MEMIVYTAIFGDYDVLRPPFPGSDCRHVCFTDGDYQCDGWEVIRVKREFSTPRLDARRCKLIGPWEMFGGKANTLWIDGSIKISTPISNLAAEFLLGDKEAALFPSRFRTCLHDEAQECIDLKKDNNEIIRDQVARYEHEGMPRNFGVGETMVLFRRPSKQCEEFCRMWWKELRSGSWRDQLSFDYCRWKTNLPVAWLNGNISNNPFFTLYPTHPNPRKTKMVKIKVVVMNHNTPDTSTELYRKLCTVFDVVVFDSGSDKDKRPKCPYESYENLYWTGCWNKAIERYGDSDVLWVIGGDVTLQDEPEKYLKCIKELWPFGIWSPVIDGRCRSMMAKGNTDNVADMWQIEGIAFAVSTKLVKSLGGFPQELRLGWGCDVWLSWQAKKQKYPIRLDRRVSVYHPSLQGYDTSEAMSEFNSYFQKILGPEWRMKVHHEGDSFSYQSIEAYEKSIVQDSISVIVSCFNQAHVLPIFLESMFFQSQSPTRVIVADDGSSDGVCKWIDENSDRYPFELLYVTRPHSGYRLAEIQNLAASHVESGRILFTNADVVHCPISIESHAKDCGVGAGMVVGLAESAAVKVTVDNVRDFSFIQRLYNENPSWRSNEKYMIETDPNKNPIGVWGGNFSVPVSAFKSLNGFDDNFKGWGGEDNNLVKRLSAAGYKVSWVTNSVCYHLDHPLKHYAKTQSGSVRYLSYG